MIDTGCDLPAGGAIVPRRFSCEAASEMLAAFERMSAVESEAAMKVSSIEIWSLPAARTVAVFNSSTERRVARFVHTTIVVCHLNDILCRHLRIKVGRDKTRTLTCSPGAPKIVGLFWSRSCTAP
ncbi:hypothetical protein FJ970_30855 [Mesorhizobium sp. B2-1-8]|uniref:hypothetical protein n=1 Tax=Mesorhizobium sp. B2-1-8 TaxID=2589967 RepID=UPI001D105F49|nr:hypothetical protein [Mesorhizobium sp. B2-1-8]UCI22614.1 hypothetical protein FJ970_30855 [Mesorhizobium sp. B2-1-8]